MHVWRSRWIIRSKTGLVLLCCTAPEGSWSTAIVIKWVTLCNQGSHGTSRLCCQQISQKLNGFRKTCSSCRRWWAKLWRILLSIPSLNSNEVILSNKAGYLSGRARSLKYVCFKMLSNIEECRVKLSCQQFVIVAHGWTSLHFIYPLFWYLLKTLLVFSYQC